MADWNNEFLSKKQVYCCLREISEDYGHHSVDKQSAALRCRDAIMEMPATDVAPIVYGKWIIPHWRNSTYCAYCSVCGEEAQHGEYKGIQKYYKFCPYCGAKIDTK